MTAPSERIKLDTLNGRFGSHLIGEFNFVSAPNLVNVIKASRLRWAGRVVRMDENELPKNIL